MSAAAKLFMHRRSQAVRLPEEFRLPGTEVLVRSTRETRGRQGHSGAVETNQAAEGLEGVPGRDRRPGRQGSVSAGPARGSSSRTRPASVPGGRICLDTNVVIGLINKREPRIRERFSARLALGAKMILPVISLFELRHRFARSVRRGEAEKQLDRLLAEGISIASFDAEDALHAGEIRMALEATGTPVGSYDALVAGQARARGATLVTANTREFDRVPGLQVVDWAR